MAGVSNRSKLSKEFSFDIVFDGALLSSTRASLIVELIKYFLYARQQIPLPLDILRNQLEQTCCPEKQEAIPDSHRHTQTCCTQLSAQEKHKFPKQAQAKGPSQKSSGDRKAKGIIDDLNKMFTTVQKAFESCPEIEQVAIILGGTVVSPKESYVIKFPPPCPDADYLPLSSCKRTLFRQIIGEDILGSLKSNMSPTNMMLLLSAPRQCPLMDFVPKQFLCSPKTGSIICFNFHCTYFVPICHELTFVEECELSGIELLHCCECTTDGSAPSAVASDGKERPTTECSLCGQRRRKSQVIDEESEFFIRCRLRRSRRNASSTPGQMHLINSLQCSIESSCVNKNSQGNVNHVQAGSVSKSGAQVEKVEQMQDQTMQEVHLKSTNKVIVSQGKDVECGKLQGKCSSVHVGGRSDGNYVVHKSNIENSKFENDCGMSEKSQDSLVENKKLMPSSKHQEIFDHHGSPHLLDQNTGTLSDAKKRGMDCIKIVNVDTDYIWYQSPFVIKGYKCQENTSFKQW